MASSNWSTLYDEVKSGVVAGIPEGPYNVEVADTRVLPGSRLIFIDFRVLDGPNAGDIAQVNLYLPEAGNRGAGFHFRNKITGFGDLSETFLQMDSAADIGGALDILSDALKGLRVQAEIELRSDGEYAGTNQLKSTKPTDAPIAAPIAAPAPTIDPNNQYFAPAAATSTSNAAAAAVAAGAGDVPF